MATTIHLPVGKYVATCFLLLKEKRKKCSMYKFKSY